MAKKKKENQDEYRGGVTKRQLTNHYREQLEKLSMIKDGPVSLEKKSFQFLKPSELCYVFDLPILPNRFAVTPSLTRYFVRCVNDAHALAKVAVPAFGKWQAGRIDGKYPVLYPHSRIVVTPIHIDRYRQIWKLADKYGALGANILPSGELGPPNPVCPDVFVLAKAGAAGEFKSLSEDCQAELKAHHVA